MKNLNNRSLIYVDQNWMATSESWSHKQHSFFDIAISLDLSKSVHISITGQDYKKLAKPAKTKSIVRWEKTCILSCNADRFTIKTM